MIRVSKHIEYLKWYASAWSSYDMSFEDLLSPPANSGANVGPDFRPVPYHLHPLLLASLPAGIVIIESKHTRTRPKPQLTIVRSRSRNRFRISQ